MLKAYDRRLTFRPVRARRRVVWRWVIGAVLAVIVAATGYVAWLGYFGGPLYTLVRPAIAPRPDERGIAVVLFSGDMGFKTGMAPKVARRIAAQGVPVIGVNSLTAFAHRLSPEQVNALVANATARALALPGTQRVVLVGQSFGANALLHGIAALPPAIRAKVPLVELVVPADTMLSLATPGGFFDGAADGPAAPFARTLDWVPVLCFHGQTEAHSLCPAWRQRNVTRITLPGDHYLNHDAALVAAELLRGIAERGPDQGATLPNVQAPQRSAQAQVS